MIYNILAIIISIIIPGLVVFLFDRNKDFWKNKYNIILYFLLFLGFFIRSVGIDVFPQGLNVDEASAGYEAYSILEYGIDRNGNSYPVFLESWGSGQNALYTYLMIPFVKLFGLNIITTRLPMVILGCLSLVIWYKLLRKIKDEKFALIGLAFLVICPWNIMKCRWGLESNLFPDLMLYAAYFIVKFMKSTEIKNLFIASVFMGFSGYAYGTSYFFLPIFCLILYVYLLITKKAKIKDLLISFGIIFIITLPVILYVFINTFGFNEFKIGPFTVPRLPINRYEQQTSLFGGNIILEFCKNLKNSLRLIITQNDNLIWNSIPGFGMIYIMSLPFFIIGVITSLKNIRVKENKSELIIDFWFIASGLLLFVLNAANVNRINIFIFPIIYYTILAIYEFMKENKKIKITLIAIYSLFFILFIYNYIITDKTESYTFVSDIKEMIEYVNKIEDKEIYIEYAFKEPYIYVLYYTKYNTKDYINTVKYINESRIGIFENIKSFGKYHFYIPEDEEKNNNEIYVLKKDINKKIDYSKYNVLKEFNEYIVIELKNNNEI